MGVGDKIYLAVMLLAAIAFFAALYTAFPI